jgi:hypothetical protein
MSIKRSFVEGKSFSPFLRVVIELSYTDLSFRAPYAPVKWPPDGTIKFFMHALITCPPGNRRFEGEKSCTRKMIGAKPGKFGEQDEVRTDGMATAPKLKRRASDIFVGDQPSGETKIHKSGC